MKISPGSDSAGSKRNAPGRPGRRHRHRPGQHWRRSIPSSPPTVGSVRYLGILRHRWPGDRRTLRNASGAVRHGRHLHPFGSRPGGGRGRSHVPVPPCDPGERRPQAAHRRPAFMRT